jgi:hypothetical protein
MSSSGILPAPPLPEWLNRMVPFRRYLVEAGDTATM